MSPLLAIILLVVLFYFLSKAADFVVDAMRALSRKLGVGVFWLGLVLGLFTSLPELAIGLSAVYRGSPDISVGNLFGGILTLLGLILGLSIILNRKIRTDGDLWHIFPSLIYILLPLFFLATSGALSVAEGVILIAGYIVALYPLYRGRLVSSSKAPHLDKQDINMGRRGPGGQIFSVLVGLAVIIICAHFIVEITMPLLLAWSVSPLVAGLTVFALGTNLPELIIAIEAWRRGSRELSLANLLGSAMANVFILGILALLARIEYEQNSSFFTLIIFEVGLFIGIAWFYVSKRSFSRREGIILVSAYLVFLIAQGAIGFGG